MNTKFVYAAYSKLSQMGRLCDKTQISWHQNYMGVEAWYSLEQCIGFEGRQAFIH